jgi:hypothetical protein
MGLHLIAVEGQPVSREGMHPPGACGACDEVRADLAAIEMAEIRRAWAASTADARTSLDRGATRRLFSTGRWSR